MKIMLINKLDYIQDKLSYIQSKINNDNKLQHYDSNKKAEDIFMHLLNLTYGWSLQNANDEVINFPAIDLMDTTNEIVIQVTSDTNKKKVKEDTVGAFNELVKEDKYKSYAHYEIKMFYIKDKPSKSTLKNWEDEGLISQSNVLGIEDINREVSADFDIADKVYNTLKKIFDSNQNQKNVEVNIDDGLTGVGNMNGGIFNQTIHNHSSQQINLTKTELKAQREKEEKLIFSTTPKPKPVYINREVDTLFSNRIAQKKGCVLFLHGQGGMGKSTLLEKFSKTDRPTIFIRINEQIEMSMVSIFLDENKTTAHNCPKFEAKLNEIFIEQKNDKEIPFNAEFELLEAIREDFGEHGVFIVDTFEKNKNSRIRSSVKFDNHTVRFSRTESHQRFRDYLNSLVHLFISHTTFIIAGRNRIDDVNESRSDEKFLNIDNVEELEMKKFSSSDIEHYIQAYKLESPTQKQLIDIENLTHGNPLILSLLVKVVSEYDGGWDELTNDEMKKIVYEDEDYGLIYYFTKRILSHVDRVDIWKLIVPRVLSKEIEPLLFGEKKIFELLVDTGLLHRGRGKERHIYTLHDDVYNAIEAHARKELKNVNWYGYEQDDDNDTVLKLSHLSWHDNEKVQNIHKELKFFYERDNVDRVGSNFNACYHNMMLKQNFESDFNKDRKEFINSFLGAIFITYKQKISFCRKFHEHDETRLKQEISKVENEMKGMSLKLYQECSAYIYMGHNENGVYDIELLESLLLKYTKKEDLLFIYYFLGQAYQDKKKYDRARETYMKAVNLYEEDLGIFYHFIGDTYSYENNDEKALEFYVKSINIKPRELSYIEVATIFEKNKKYDEAIDLYQRAIKLNPDNEQTYIDTADCYFEKRPLNYEKAFEFYNKAIEINPKNEDAYQSLGILFFRQKKYQDVIDTYQIAIGLNLNDEWFYRLIGHAYYKLDNSKKAIKYHQKAIAINPNKSILYNDIGLDFFLDKSYKKAIESFKKAIELESSNFIFYNNLGDVYYYMDDKEYDNARNCYENSLKIKNNRSALFQLAQIHMKKKEYSSAIKIFKQLNNRHELIIAYFFNRNYILMFKTIKKKLIEEQLPYSIQYKILEKIFKISKKKLENIWLILLGVEVIGIYWINYFITSKIIDFFA